VLHWTVKSDAVILLNLTKSFRILLFKGYHDEEQNSLSAAPSKQNHGIKEVNEKSVSNITVL